MYYVQNICVGGFFGYIEVEKSGNSVTDVTRDEKVFGILSGNTYTIYEIGNNQ